jgi:hypothetical protein
VYSDGDSNWRDKRKNGETLLVAGNEMCAIQILKIKIYRSIILPVVLYGCETLSLILREERRLKVFENRVLRKVFGPKRDEVTGNGENYIIRSLMICTPYQYCAGGKIEKNEMGWACGAYGGGERCAQGVGGEA